MNKKYFYSVAAAFCFFSVDAQNLEQKNTFSKSEHSALIKKTDTLGNRFPDKSNGNTERVAAKDWMKAPNSYIFEPSQANDGIYIPVKKAYAMWTGYKFLGYSEIPDGIVTADVLWEDNHGLIKSGLDYSLEIEGSGESAKIKVPVNKSKEGNAVVVFRVNGEIFWSWHIWVTDDPTNVSNYKIFAVFKI